MAFLRIMATLGLDGKGFAIGLKQAERQATTAAAKIRNVFLGAFSVAFFTQATRATVRWGSAINDSAKKIGVTAEAMQELQFAAKQTGTELNSITNAFRFLSTARAEALKDPGGEKAGLFRMLGIEPDELKSFSLKQLFDAIGDQVKNRDFGANLPNIMTQLFGRGSLEIIPLLKEGIRELSEEAHRAGGIVSDKTIADLDKLGDAWERLIATVRGPFAEALTGVANQIESIFKETERLLGIVESRLPSGLGGHARNSEIPPHLRPIQFPANRRGAGFVPPDNVQIPIEQDVLEKEEKLKKAARMKQIESDELARIGGFIGGTNRTVTLQERQERHLANVARHTQRMAERGVKLEGQP